MTHGIFIKSSKEVLRPFKSENAAKAFLPSCGKGAYVAPIVWVEDAKFLAGGHFLEAK